ncbi:MAG: hypothetical protein Q7S27_01240 [Nanoarchaeota archaeon]|nr:hypothetical protein [Nanoarchaeota archaeon]
MKTRRLNSAVTMFKNPVLERIENQEHIMALAVDKSSRRKLYGLARVIVRREGDVNIAGYIDRSQLYHVKSDDGLKWEQVGKLEIKGIDKIVDKYKKKGSDFIGLEDPDIWIDEGGNRHVYFTIPFIGQGLYLGHAKGNSLDNLIATDPVLKPEFMKGISGFKEVAISPIEYRGSRINLTEAGNGDNSVIAAVKSKDMGKKWEYLKIALHPKDTGYKWCAEHLSPCTFFPPNFLSYGQLLVGIVNGREKSIQRKDETIYKKFRPGLIVYDYKTGEIPWISEEPLFEDPKAKAITFASDFLQETEDEGILYAHIDDSFVRAYKLNAKGLRKRLPEKI